MTISRPCYRLIFDDGTTLICSAEHQWLVSGVRARGYPSGARWIETRNLRASGKYASKVVKPVEAWETDTSWEAGYLAAAFDGEGNLSQRDPARAGGADVKLVFAQNGNPMLLKVRQLLADKGFAYINSISTERSGRLCCRVHFSQRREIIKFLGQIRPSRLLKKFDPNKLGAINCHHVATVVSKEKLGDMPVVAIRTSTKTYIVEGLASHNCDDFAYDLEEKEYAVELKGRANYPTLRYAHLFPKINASMCTSPTQRWQGAWAWRARSPRWLRSGDYSFRRTRGLRGSASPSTHTLRPVFPIARSSRFPGSRRVGARRCATRC